MTWITLCVCIVRVHVRVCVHTCAYAGTHTSVFYYSVQHKGRWAEFGQSHDSAW